MITKNNEETHIYGLYDPISEKLRYIGRTKNVENRFKSHIYRYDKDNTAKSDWIWGLKNKGLTPKVRALYTANSLEGAKKIETELIIFHRMIGDDLLNKSDGDGTLGLKMKDNAKDVISKSNYGKKLTKEHIEKRSNTIRGTSNAQGTKMKQDSRSKYVGVYKNTKNRWAAQIYHHNKKIYLGSFKTEEEAAEAYNAKAIEIFGSNAKLNIIKEN